MTVAGRFKFQKADLSGLACRSPGPARSTRDKVADVHCGIGSGLTRRSACDKAQDPRARRARTENGRYVIYGPKLSAVDASKNASEIRGIRVHQRVPDILKRQFEAEKGPRKTEESSVHLPVGSPYDWG
jgi:hypothetical protein